MFDKTKEQKTTKGTTLVAENTVVSGDVRFADQLFVNGRIEGNVFADKNTKATLIISEVGKVVGEIRVPHVVINGMVEGDVHATSRVELAAKAKVKGNVYYQLIEMQLGAMVDGQLVHSDDAAAPAAKVHQFKAAEEADTQTGG